MTSLAMQRRRATAGRVWKQFRSSRSGMIGLGVLLLFVLMALAINCQGRGDTTQISIQFPFLGIVTLLLILMLELKDKLLARLALEPIRQLALFGEGEVGVGFEDEAAMQFLKAIARAHVAVANGRHLCRRKQHCPVGRVANDRIVPERLGSQLIQFALGLGAGRQRRRRRQRLGDASKMVPKAQ